jgi:hypothetical protein
MALVSHGIAVRVQARRQLEPKCRSNQRQKVDRLRNGITCFQARDSPGTDAEPSRELPLTEPCGKSGFDQLRREALSQLAAAAFADCNGGLAHRHRWSIAHSPYPLLTPLIRARVIRRRAGARAARSAAAGRLQTPIDLRMDQTTKKPLRVGRIKRTRWPASSLAPWASRTPPGGRWSDAAGAAVGRTPPGRPLVGRRRGGRWSDAARAAVGRTPPGRPPSQRAAPASRTCTGSRSDRCSS